MDGLSMPLGVAAHAVDVLGVVKGQS